MSSIRGVYGAPPLDLGHYEVGTDEMMLYQYLPIKMAHCPCIRVPLNLDWVVPLLDGIQYELDDYVYLTAKRMYATKHYKGNRAGWHSDGFLTDDVSYIWYDSHPTEFAIQQFEITPDCDVSLKEFEEQVDIDKIVTYPNKHLLALDQSVIHRVSESDEEGMRTFVKINVSKDKYNLKGNSHNYLFDYNWEMLDRQVERNHPHKES